MRVMLLGFGEAGQAFATGWRAAGVPFEMCTYDRLFDGDAGDSLRARAKELDVVCLDAPEDGADDVSHVFSFVTADQSLAAAARIAPHLGATKVFWDANSVAPATKEKAAAEIVKSGARYIDMAVLAPVYPKGHRAPLALADPKLDAALWATFDFDVAYQFKAVGQAAALKLLRSIVIKGMEGLLVECCTAADQLGLTEETLASLAPSFPGIDWPARAAYALERVAQHGPRRAAEMAEAAAFLRDINISPLMAEATSQRIASFSDKDMPVE